MAEIHIGDNESLDAALRRFKRIMQRDGIMAEMRRREHYVKPSVRRKQKAQQAKRRRG
ncbi:MAG: 30S ribosomal protein S21 [Limnochordaceae bacterium]|uniref:Small ribosomal subunit protein bS21 n=1 Tax=Carboxydichorda subterranea TaxID=3109565 RepID=A0ABZ1BZR9_9FIRM|nr:30S ribosomal protein S21 [Limnochorda sp. L945t]MBE3598202.1 30S ribosomal protein S21 [Limnochordaceae bacterium]WRP18272.1 30S ribosomal protein S21 [Limnochorda sp. L945t]